MSMTFIAQDIYFILHDANTHTHDGAPAATVVVVAGADGGGGGVGED